MARLLMPHPHGTFTVSGWLDLADLYPTGNADADTLPITVHDAIWNGTRVLRDFRKWVAIGRVRSRVVDEADRVRVRLFGVDAPELHYRPAVDAKTAAALRKKGVGVPHFRQPGAVRTAARLRERLAKFGPRVFVRAIRLTAQPEDSIDTYGRLVAQLVLPDHHSLDGWLLRTGLGAPALYSGFTDADRMVITHAASEGRRALAARWTTPTGPFPWTVVTGNAPTPSKDVGRFVHPKLFRRWATWAVQRRAGTTRLAFPAWLDKSAERNAGVATGNRIAPFRERLSTLLRAAPAVFSQVVFPAAAGRIVVPGGRDPR